MKNELTKTTLIYSNFESSLANGATFNTGVLDFASANRLRFCLRSDTVGLTYTFQTRADVAQPWTAPFDFVSNTIIELFSIVPNQRYYLITVTNNTGGPVTNVSMEVYQTFGSSDGATVAPLDVQPIAQTQGIFTQSVIRGLDRKGQFRSVIINEGGGLLAGDFGLEVARGFIPSYTSNTKFGRNPQINTNSTPEDLWNGSTLYSGFNSINNQNAQVFSGSASDTGALRTSGTVTASTSTTLTNSSATFITNGVAIGDVILNDSNGTHGFVTSINSQTQLTVFRWVDGISNVPKPEIGDTYRIAYATGTGAGVIRLVNALNSNYEKQIPKYVIMNGTSIVTVLGDFYRLSTARVIKSGSNQRNAGVITIRQAVTTANVFIQMPTLGATTIGVDTVPKGIQRVIKRLFFQISRANGSAGSATVSLNVREPGGNTFNSIRVFEPTTSVSIAKALVGGIVLQEGTDMKWTVDSVSDNGTVAVGEFEFYDIIV